MKVLYISNYKDGTGWSHAAINYILALDTVGVDIVPRCIKLNNINGEVPERILELETKNDKNCDIVIQHVLPHMMKYDGKFKKNIGLYVTETSNFIDMGWSSFLNCMDELWVPNWQMIDAAKNSNIETPLHYIPHTFDMTKYSQSYDKVSIQQLDGNFIFYFIGEFTQRKNLLSLIKAFHIEFNSNENVSLVIKSNIPGQSPEVSQHHIRELCNAVKTQLKLYKNKEDYTQEIIIPHRFLEEQMMQLHTTCDCLICPSYAEAWHIPAFEAMALGKSVIANNVGGLKEFIIDNTTGLLISNTPEPVYGVLDSFSDLYTGHETWYNINIADLRKAMRKIFENQELRNKFEQNGIDKAYEFSYQKIGQLMKERLYNG
jgi:glycosyltransferase involved in cell wall biosynthesis